MKDSHIQWTDHTFNPWEGCTKVSPGCANCYAEARNKRFNEGKNWGKGAPRRRTSESNWNDARRWNRASMERFAAHNREAQGSFGHLSEMLEDPARPKVFCASLADWLDDEIPTDWFLDLVVLVYDCAYLDWLLLTKRPENFRARMQLARLQLRNHREPSERNAAIGEWMDAWVEGRHPGNVWAGTTVEDQKRVGERIPWLLQIPAEVHFLSCEPLLERIDLGEVLWTGTACANCGDGSAFGRCCDDPHRVSHPSVDWVIVGGESGPGARATSVDAIEHVIWQCREEAVAVFVKQLGARPRLTAASKIGFGTAVEGTPGDLFARLKHCKGGDPEEWPERFRVQQFPKQGGFAS